MATQQQDYLLRQIELLGQFAARLRRRQKPWGDADRAELNEALLLAMHLQEKNFAMPAVEFLRLTADEQIAALTAGTAGGERCLAYAAILKETADLYVCRDEADLARGARRLALYVALSATLAHPAHPDGPGLIRELLAVLEVAELPLPTRELLDAYQRQTG